MTVEDPEVIDMIGFGPDTAAQMIVIAVEGRPLRDDLHQLEQIKAKFARYLFALDSGQVSGSEGRLVLLQLQVPNEPRTPLAIQLLTQIYDQCANRGMGFSVLVHVYPDSYRPLVGMTDDEARPHDPITDEALSFPVERETYSDDELAALEVERPAFGAAAEQLRAADRSARDIDRPRESRLTRFRRLLIAEPDENASPDSSGDAGHL